MEMLCPNNETCDKVQLEGFHLLYRWQQVHRRRMLSAYWEYPALYASFTKIETVHKATQNIYIF